MSFASSAVSFSGGGTAVTYPQFDFGELPDEAGKALMGHVFFFVNDWFRISTADQKYGGQEASALLNKVVVALNGQYSKLYGHRPRPTEQIKLLDAAQDERDANKPVRTIAMMAEEMRNRQNVKRPEVLFIHGLDSDEYIIVACWINAWINWCIRVKKFKPITILQAMLEAAGEGARKQELAARTAIASKAAVSALSPKYLPKTPPQEPCIADNGDTQENTKKRCREEESQLPDSSIPMLPPSVQRLGN